MLDGFVDFAERHFALDFVLLGWIGGVEAALEGVEEGEQVCQLLYRLLGRLLANELRGDASFLADLDCLCGQNAVELLCFLIVGQGLFRQFGVRLRLLFLL